jgi:hypothetical protein
MKSSTPRGRVLYLAGLGGAHSWSGDGPLAGVEGETSEALAAESG